MVSITFNIGFVKRVWVVATCSTIIALAFASTTTSTIAFTSSLSMKFNWGIQIYFFFVLFSNFLIMNQQRTL